MKRTSLTVLGVALAALALAACGSSSSSSSSSSANAASAGGGGSATRTKLAACLKSHGVTPPSGGRHFRPGGAGGGAPGASGGFGGGAPGGLSGGRGFAGNPKFQAALKSCGATFPRRSVNPAARKAAIQNFVSCVRQHGYSLPQPNFSGHGSVFPAKIATNAKFRAASRTCLTALRGPGGSGSGGSAGA